MRTLELELPWPVSTNGYWRSFRGRQIISKRGRDFRKAALAAIGSDILTFGDSPVSVFLSFHAPTKRKYDIANFEKGISDAMTHAGVWDDDNQIDEMHLKRGAISPRNGFVFVRISEICE